MAKPRKQIEARFRRGSNAFIAVGLLSALANSLLYSGVKVLPIKVFCLAVPVVLDTAVRLVDPRLWGAELHYYCYLFGLILSGLFLLLGILSKFSSHTGTFLKLTSRLRGLSGVRTFLGRAQLAGSRLFYFLGIVLYVADAVLALLMENFLHGRFDELRLVILLNLGFHCLVLVVLLHGFVAGMESETPAPKDAD